MVVPEYDGGKSVNEKINVKTMSNNSQDDITNAELAKLIESVAVNLVSLQEKVTAFQENVEQRFQRIEDTVVTKTYLDIRLEKIEAGAFTPDEKKSVLDTVKLINDRWGEDETGTKHITLTREEYDMLMESVRLPNRFLKPEMIEVE